MRRGGLDTGIPSPLPWENNVYKEDTLQNAATVQRVTIVPQVSLRR